MVRFHPLLPYFFGSIDQRLSRGPLKAETWVQVPMELLKQYFIKSCESNISGADIELWVRLPECRCCEGE